MAEGSKLMSVLLAIVALCALVAIILSAVTMSRPQSVPTISIGSMAGGGSNSGSSSPQVIYTPSSSGQDSGSKMWLIAVGHDYGAHEYIDDKGFLSGFTVEMVAEVCQAAGIRCRVVWDKYVNCWDSTPGEHSVGGKGLHGRYYDGCAGWWATVGRVQIFDFSMPYMKNLPSYFFVKKGDTLDGTNIKGKKIGFMDGWASDEKCVARQQTITGNILPKGDVKHYPLVQDSVAALMKHEIDAVFSTADAYAAYTEGDNATMTIVSGEQFFCSVAGSSVMTRKDGGLNGHWNRGYTMMRENGRLRKLCEESQARHKHKGELLECIV